MKSSTIELLDSLAEWLEEGSIASDYRLAKDYFRITASKVSRWRTGRETFSDERVVQICEDIWPGDDAAKARWLLRVHADREQNEQVREVWERLARSVAVAVFAMGLGVAGAPVEAGISTDRTMYYAHKRRRRAPARATRHENTSAEWVAA